MGTFRKMDQKYSMNSLKEQLQLMKEHGEIYNNDTIDVLTHCLSGAMNEAALWIAENSNRQQSINKVMKTLEILLAGYRQ
ncbi:hypothetical protein SPD89_06680 [Pseudogracilibacillus sp. SO30301A]